MSKFLYATLILGMTATTGFAQTAPMIPTTPIKCAPSDKFCNDFQTAINDAAIIVKDADSIKENAIFTNSQKDITQVISDIKNIGNASDNQSFKADIKALNILASGLHDQAIKIEGCSTTCYMTQAGCSAQICKDLQTVEQAVHGQIKSVTDATSAADAALQTAATEANNLKTAAGTFATSFAPLPAPLVAGAATLEKALDAGPITTFYNDLEKAETFGLSTCNSYKGEWTQLQTACQNPDVQVMLSRAPKSK